MEFLLYSVTYVLYLAWLFLLMFAAFELAMYLLAAVIDMVVSYQDHGFKWIVRNPMRTLRDMHNAGVMTLRTQKWALV